MAPCSRLDKVHQDFLHVLLDERKGPGVFKYSTAQVMSVDNLHISF